MSIVEMIKNEPYKSCYEHGYSEGMADGRTDVITELKSLLRCRNYRGCFAGKGCDGVCRIDSSICKSCENFGIPYSLLSEWQKGAENE